MPTHLRICGCHWRALTAVALPLQAALHASGRTFAVAGMANFHGFSSAPWSARYGVASPDCSPPPRVCQRPWIACVVLPMDESFSRSTNPMPYPATRPGEMRPQTTIAIVPVTMGIHGSTAEFADHFGRVGRAVFAGETWNECASCLRESWDLLDPGITWDEALSDIRRGWTEALTKPQPVSLPDGSIGEI